MSQAKNICYVIKKVWNLNDAITIDHRKFVFDLKHMCDVGVFMCNVSHEDYVKMLLGKDTYKPITDAMCINSEPVAYWCRWRHELMPVQYPSYDEFMLDVNINMQIVPCIKYYSVKTYNNLIPQIVKIVDCESSEVLWQAEPTSISCLGWQA